MQVEILKVLSQMQHPLIVAACTAAVAAIVLILMWRAEKPLLAGISAAAIVLLGLVPLAATSYAKSRAVYQVHIEVLRPDESPADIAQLKSSQPGELKMVPGGWDLVVPVKERPIDRKITFSASVKDEFLTGESSLILAEDFYPTATVRLVAITSAMLRGVVVDEDMRAVEGAKVSVEGNPQAATTDSRGNFVVAAHASNGQIVEVRAKKGQASARVSAKAGKTVEIILNSR